MNRLGRHNRQQSINQLNSKKYDFIVIGGGITGAGIALDAAARGLSIALFEMQDFASGTSSRSTKLIHGGLRYLKQLEIKVVAEVGQERAIVYENGPHVTTPEWMLLPLYKKGTYGKWSTRFGLTVYDLLARVKKNERKKMLTRQQTLELAPLLKQEGLVGGGYYVEYKTDDARLTIDVIKKAVELGAQALNYTKVTKLLYEHGKLIGAQVQDNVTGEKYNVYAKKVINATGPWVDDIRELDQSKEGKTLKLTKGVHIIFDQKYFPLKQAVYFDTPDGRMCFAIPRGEKTYFGTTDTNYSGDKVYPVMTIEDEKYLLHAINYMFPALQLRAEHIESSYAGLRPLIHQDGKDASEISRKDEIFVSHSGLISIAGGKLTGYRKMAEAVVNKAIAILKSENVNIVTKKIDTRRIAISGGNVGGSQQFDYFIKQAIERGNDVGLEQSISNFLVKKYGDNFQRIILNIDIARQWSNAYDLDLETALMLIYAIEEEMILTVEDFLVRRTGYLLFDIKKAQKLKAAVAEILAIEFGWDDQEKHKQIDSFNKRILEIKSSV